jgi:hypothetical protein
MKNLFLCTVFLAVIGFSSCGDKITEEIYNVNSFSKSYVIYNADPRVAGSPKWELYEGEEGPYYICQFQVPELTQEVFDYGVMNTYFRYFLNGYEILSPLPFSDFFSRGNAQWEEQMTVEYEVGYITFIMKYDDQGTNYQYYDNYEFTLRLLW